MFERFKRWRDAAIDRDAEHLIWTNKTEYLIRGCIDNRDDDILHQKLREHVARGVAKGFLPYNIPKLNKKSLEIK